MSDTFEARQDAFMKQWMRSQNKEFRLPEDDSRDTAEQAANRATVYGRWNAEGSKTFIEIYQAELAAKQQLIPEKKVPKNPAKKSPLESTVSKKSKFTKEDKSEKPPKKVKGFSPPVPAEFPDNDKADTTVVTTAAAVTPLAIEKAPTASAQAPPLLKSERTGPAEGSAPVKSLTVYMIKHHIPGYSGKAFQVTDRLRSQNTGHGVDFNSRYAAMVATGAIVSHHIYDITAIVSQDLQAHFPCYRQSYPNECPAILKHTSKMEFSGKSLQPGDSYATLLEKKLITNDKLFLGNKSDFFPFAPIDQATLEEVYGKIFSARGEPMTRSDFVQAEDVFGDGSPAHIAQIEEIFGPSFWDEDKARVITEVRALLKDKGFTMEQFNEAAANHRQNDITEKCRIMNNGGIVPQEELEGNNNL